MNDLQINIQGFPVVNSDIKAEIRDIVSGQPIKSGTPFRDGTVTFPRLDAGLYQLVLTHPNLAGVLLQQPIRVLPGTLKTQVSILIDPSKFKNTPIEDVPDANLTPLLDAARQIEENAKNLANKQGGEAILAGDWNAMATRTAEMAHAFGELTRVVSPQGHNHPEYERKLNELSSNFDSLVTTLSASMVEIQRQLQIRRLLDHADVIINSLPPAEQDAASKKVRVLTDNLFEKTSESPRVFSALISSAAAEIDQIVQKAPILTNPTTPQEQTTRDRFREVIETSKAARAIDYRTELIETHKANVRLGSVRITR
jgi:hypothetical protein